MLYKSGGQIMSAFNNIYIDLIPYQFLNKINKRRASTTDQNTRKHMGGWNSISPIKDYYNKIKYYY